LSATCSKCGATWTHTDAAFCGTCGAPAGWGTPERVPRQSPSDASEASPAGAPGAPPHGTIPAEPLPAALDPPPAPPAGAPAREKPVTPPRHLGAGTLIDKKYAVLRVLGEGGMGVVYLARDIHTGLDVVVKAVRCELSHREDVRARTLAEGRALAQIDHPNVVHLRAVAVDGPNLFLVMQYIDGESLDRIIAGHAERGEPMPVEEALGVLRQVAAGVGAAHEEGVIHRDLKPANVLLRKKDRVAKVTDFGIALVPSDTSRPHTRGILGSLWYMSPEQVTGRRDLDLRVDVYALGIMLYQMLVGRVPFDAKSDYEIMKLHAEAPMPLAASARPDVPGPVDDIIQKACAKDRDQRFERCEDLCAAVDRLLGLTPATRGQTPYAALVPSITQSTGTAQPVAPSAPGEDSRVEPAPAPPGDAGSSPGDDEALVPPPRRGIGLWIGAALLLLGGGAAAVMGMGLVPGVPGAIKGARPATSAEVAPPGASASADAGRPALEALVGTWVGNGRELTAVVAGGDVEFRVKKPEQFAPQNYEAGEARFVLHATGDASVFVVEDRIRPVPPKGKIYDARARGTCQEVWTVVGGDALRARHDGARLSVEFAKIEPGPANFTTEGGKVTSCVGLRNLKASKVVSVLTRP
jgi:eukaryotic-like serine/threonine-protein kinase